MKSFESKGKSVDEAIFNGLKEMGLSLDEVKIDILDDGTKGGFLGLGKQAHVLLTEREDEEAVNEAAEEFLSGVFELMDIDAKFNMHEDGENLKIDIVGNDLGNLIGRRGETLDALQYLTSLVVNRGSEQYIRIMLDTEDYRAKREQTLVKLARRLAGKTKKTGQRTVLEPMNPYERRILHSTLQNDPYVTTYSEGEEPFRHVVIDIKKQDSE